MVAGSIRILDCQTRRSAEAPVLIFASRDLEDAAEQDRLARGNVHIGKRAVIQASNDWVAHQNRRIRHVHPAVIDQAKP